MRRRSEVILLIALIMLSFVSGGGGLALIALWQHRLAADYPPLTDLFRVEPA